MNKNRATIINTKQLSSALGVTQAWHVGMGSTHIPVTENSVPRIFSDTLAASFTGEVLVTVGTGAMSAESHAKILTQFAFDKGRRVQEVSSEYVELVGSLARDPLIFRSLIATIIGTSERDVSRSISTSKFAVVTPTMVFTELERILTRSTSAKPDDIYLYLLADYVCHLLRPFGWVVPDSGYTYRLRRPSVFPSFEDIEDLLATRELTRILKEMASADLGTVKRSLEQAKSISPALISTHMTSALLSAFELSKSSYDGFAVASSVITTLYRMHDPSTPEELRPSPRVYKSQVANNLLSNLALFLVAQNLAKLHPTKMDVAYSDEELVSEILPLFEDAINSSATFKRRMLSDVVEALGKRSAYDAYGAPTHTVLYEGYSVEGTMEAFVPVAQLRQTKGKYLVPQNDITGALNSVLRPVTAHMNVNDMVEQRMQVFELAAAESRGHDNGVWVYLAFPSIIEREIALGVPAGELQTYIMTGKRAESAPLEEGGEIAPLADYEREFVALQYDYYALITHLAMARLEGQTPSIMPVKANEIENIVLVWEGRTRLKHPLGESAVYQGVVSTAEPIEALAYRDDFKNTKNLQTHPIDLKAHEHDVHVWPWYQASRELTFSAVYQARVKNKSYMVNVRDFELLGLGVHRTNAHYLIPRNAAAAVRLWANWIISEEGFITAQLANGTAKRKDRDLLVEDAYQGLRLQTGISITRMLANIGTTGVGGKVNTLVRRRLAEQMYGEGDADAVSQLVVGIQAARLNVWSGLTTLSLLGLLSAEEVGVLFDIVKETKAMALFVNSSMSAA